MESDCKQVHNKPTKPLKMNKLQQLWRRITNAPQEEPIHVYDTLCGIKSTAYPDGRVVMRRGMSPKQIRLIDLRNETVY